MFDLSFEPMTITIGVDTSQASQVWLVAKENGFFNDLPFDVNIREFSHEADSLTNFFLGHVHIAHTPFVDYLYGASVNEHDPCIIFVGKPKTYLTVESSEVSEDDKALHVVGMTPLTAMYYMRQLETHSNVDYRLTSSDIVIDGMSMYYSTDKSMQMVEDNMPDVMIISSKLAEESPELLSLLMQAYYQGVVYLKRHPERMENQENYMLFSSEERDRFMQGKSVDTMISQIEALISDVYESPVDLDSKLKFLYMDKEE